MLPQSLEIFTYLVCMSDTVRYSIAPIRPYVDGPVRITGHQITIWLEGEADDVFGFHVCLKKRHRETWGQLMNLSNTFITGVFYPRLEFMSFFFHFEDWYKKSFPRIWYFLVWKKMVSYYTIIIKKNKTFKNQNFYGWSLRAKQQFLGLILHTW